jgi:hypothetical protein
VSYVRHVNLSGVELEAIEVHRPCRGDPGAVKRGIAPWAEASAPFVASIAALSAVIDATNAQSEDESPAARVDCPVASIVLQAV